MGYQYVPPGFIVDRHRHKPRRDTVSSSAAIVGGIRIASYSIVLFGLAATETSIHNVGDAVNSTLAIFNGLITDPVSREGLVTYSLHSVRQYFRLG